MSNLRNNLARMNLSKGSKLGHPCNKLHSCCFSCCRTFIKGCETKRARPRKPDPSSWEEQELPEPPLSPDQGATECCAQGKGGGVHCSDV